jgi:transitional endoplasmic reticulum ATPase
MLPIDLMGAALGESENTVAAFFGFARKFDKCIILLDNINHLLCQQNDEPSALSGGKFQERGLPHSRARLQSSFLAGVDSLRSAQACVLIIGTASDNMCDSTGRVDKVFSMEAPNDSERQRLISSSFDVRTGDDPAIRSLFDDLVECTVGRSRSEIVQYCRQAVASCSNESETPVTNKQLLLAMKASLQTLVPESLRTGIVGDFVDMKVLTARDLKLPAGRPGTFRCPLFGKDAELTWIDLQGLVVTPLCQANVLDELLYGKGVGGGKTVCGGVLLSGPPGSGKSTLAQYCASVAANLLPSVTLLDVSCTSLVHKEVGGSERAVRHLFASARAAAPCILLMDGIENVAAVRGNDNTTEGTMDRILSTLLIELDGVDNQSSLQHEKIAVIGITHNESWIDSALRRPGRLEKVIKLQYPDYDARYQIVIRELQSLASSDTTLSDASEYNMGLASYVASRTVGMSGAEVIAVCSEARMTSAREYLDGEKTEPDEFGWSITRNHFFASGPQSFARS